MTYAPVGWGIAVVLAFGLIDAQLGSASDSALETTGWVWPTFAAVNGLAMLLARYASSLPGRYLPLPHKAFWLATPTRQAHYFNVTVTVVWVTAALESIGIASLVTGLTGSGTKMALGSIGFLAFNIIALGFALFWPTKRLRPGAQAKRTNFASLDSGRAYSRQDLE